MLGLQASAKEALLLLMNVEMVSSRTQDLSFGLVPALNLAEGGKDIRARQMGGCSIPNFSRRRQDVKSEMVEVVVRSSPLFLLPLPSLLPLGYLYLNENLTSKNEISLLLFNTILKVSSHPFLLPNEAQPDPPLLCPPPSPRTFNPLTSPPSPSLSNPTSQPLRPTLLQQ